MDGRQASEKKPRRGRGLGRAVWVSYLSTGAALAISRVSLLAWVEHQPGTETVYNLLWLLRPEILLVCQATAIGPDRIRGEPDTVEFSCRWRIHLRSEGRGAQRMGQRP